MHRECTAEGQVCQLGVSAGVGDDFLWRSGVLKTKV